IRRPHRQDQSDQARVLAHRVQSYNRSVMRRLQLCQPGLSAIPGATVDCLSPSITIGKFRLFGKFRGVCMFKWAGRTLAACVVLAAVPASAQSNLSGVWNNLGILNEDWPDRLPGPELGDYAGLPVNDAVRARADARDAWLIPLPEYQCRVHPSDYVSSFAGLRIWEERDSASQQLIALRTHNFSWSTDRTIWMDGLPHPPKFGQHTAMAFSTGK